MQEKIERIEVTLNTELMLEVMARRCNYANVGDLLEAIASNMDLCRMIENFLKYQADDIEFY